MAQKMNVIQQSSVTQNLENDLLPPPPPPDILEAAVKPSTTVEEHPQNIPPPPQQAFAKFHQQRQINELKRLYKHMHPELRKNLQEVVSEDWAEVLNAEQAAAALATGTHGFGNTVLQTEVQSMRWIFDNWPLDTIGDHQGAKKLKDEETILSGDVKNTSWKFENQTINDISAQYSEFSENSVDGKEQIKGDVRTALWLFETQPMDSLNKTYSSENDLQEAVLKEPVRKGDVKGAKLLFETHPLGDLGRSNSVEESSILQLRSEIQELKGDVNKTVKLFETEPLCAIRDTVGNIHQIKSICREEVQHSGNVQSARWLFETQPLGSINQDLSRVKIIRGISLEETQQGGVGRKRWLFETQALDTIKEQTEESNDKASVKVIEGGDVNKKCWLFETQPLDTLKETPSEEVTKEEVIGGNVRSSLWLFETQPMESLKDSFEVGHLKRVVTEEEKGDVKKRTRIFESCCLDSINKEQSETSDTSKTLEIQKGDVKTYKSLFETLPLHSFKNSDEISPEKQTEVLAGHVNENRALFETIPLYAIMDSAGHCHQVKTVSREQVVSGDVKHYRWMFETRRLDQFDEDTQNVELVKGITKEEIHAGNMETTRWLFETQPLDVIHANINKTEIQSSDYKDVVKGDVNTCRWLFETQPMDALYEKLETKQEDETQLKGNVKSYTWLFETQALDSINEKGEQQLKVLSANHDDVKGVDVKTTKHLFETEQIGNMTGGLDEAQNMRYTSEVDIQSGNVSRVKEIYQSTSLNEIGDVVENVNSIKSMPLDATQSGSGCVHKFTWLFENCPIDSIKEMTEEHTPKNTITDIKGGDVCGKRFVFETHSLDQIKDKTDIMDLSSRKEESVAKGDVKSCTMLFETQPLYAIRDKEGQYHEVTAATKEEIMKGDVRGTRWLFETKPLDTIKPMDEVFVLRAVTQEDVQHGDVTAARWKFETQPLDSIKDEARPGIKVVDEVQGGNVQASKQLFEGQQINRKYVRMVSVSDVQSGDVRTSTWLFENLPIDSLKGAAEESTCAKTVHREDVQKGDVKRCTWLFESQPLDSFKDSDTTLKNETKERVTDADVKSTTWLFETTPLDTFIRAQCSTESADMTEQSVQTSLQTLYNCKAILSRGLLIESSEVGILKMAKYQLMNHNGPHILKEEVIGGVLQRILWQLLQKKESLHPEGIVLKEDGSGRISSHKVQLFSHCEGGVKKDGDIANEIYNLLNQDGKVKKGILIQETESKIAQITVYSLVNRQQSEEVEKEVIKGDVKSTIDSLLASTKQQTTSMTVKREENEKGNVQLYTTCIESGTLDYLKRDQEETDDSTVSAQKEEIVRGDVEGAIRNLKQSGGQIERTVDDIVPGDVKGTKKYFLTEPQTAHDIVQKEDILGCNSNSINQFLGQAANQSTGVENEELVTGDDKAPPQSVKSVKYQTRQLDTEGIVHHNTKDTLVTLQESTSDKKGMRNGQHSEPFVHLLGGASRAVPEVRAENTAGQDLQVAMENLREVAAEAQTTHHKSSTREQFKSSAQNSAAFQSHQATQYKTSTEKIKKNVQMSTQQQGSMMPRHRTCTQMTVTQPQQLNSQQNTQQVSAYEGQGHFRSDSAYSNEGQKGEYLTKVVNNGRTEIGAASEHVQTLGQYSSTNLEEEDWAVADQEIIAKGDVKSTIQSLKHSVAEQKSVKREEVVRGNLEAALHSLGKANMNVSKGDFKTAMIYRTAGQSHSSDKMKSGVRTDCSRVSLSQSDTESPPPFPVTERPVLSSEACGQLSVEARPFPCNRSESTAVKKPANSQYPPPLPPKAHERSNVLSKPSIAPKPHTIPPARPMQAGKPMPPPKPEHLPSIHSSPSPTNPPKSYASAVPIPNPLLSKGCNTPGFMLMGKPGRTSIPTEDVHPSDCQPGQQKRHCEQSLSEQASSTMASYTKVLRTPLQLAEEKYKQTKEGHSKPTVMVINPVAHVVLKGNSSGNHVEANGPMKTEQEIVPKEQTVAETQQGFKQSYSQQSMQSAEMSQGSKAALYTSGTQDKQSSPQMNQASSWKEDVTMTETMSALPKEVEIMQPEITAAGKAQKSYLQPRPSPELYPQESFKVPFEQQPAQSSQYNRCMGQHGFSTQTVATNRQQGHLHTEQQRTPQPDAVVMRGKRQQGKETEDDRRKRLSVHKEEIMRGNVKAAMEIFENLRKREELHKILSQVKEFEEETFQVNVKGLKSLFENVPEWVVPKNKVAKQLKPTDRQKDEFQNQPNVAKDELESLSSMELVFEDLERASMEIIYLKEQTLAKLLHIEESIKKALYSVSNLKSESDIVGLSGLFRESLGVASSSPSGNIKKISLVSSKSSAEKAKERKEDQIRKEMLNDSEKQVLDIPAIPARVSTPSSPSYISIESAARKPTGSLKNNPPIAPTESMCISPAPQNEHAAPLSPKATTYNDFQNPVLCNGHQGDTAEKAKHDAVGSKNSVPKDTNELIQTEDRNGNKIAPINASNGVIPLSGFKGNVFERTQTPVPQRSKSVVEFKTGPDGGEIVGTKTVMEKYEEIDRFGNKIITSKTSTTVTKQSESRTSSTYEVVQAPPKYEVATSPRMGRYLQNPSKLAEDSYSNAKESGAMFVSIGNPNSVKKC
ncbi:xin actin-binding repeat-containing protein 1-like [Stegostoma tigrinum]|uniref:xin actin-binding repeat-containing protein 1-like n=1 Tax=Stegostoma tigrinum TaxID=3053191 RepID=UPI0028706287|nr:xin actin-binding repeat-containing protein 1-like [Stegostoma tigrinum]XP_048385650.2 xin actin-binding repeat-containing protein 1-like [Stegostoma tigrinum]XP_048385652.2 xin actin-binding repeat-containing protein 1-like [Stegostoma tigrinum]XP_048385653.2 xin actin-binding repeat-containing protein 1-like [Stegostoma tigrinum]